jgi:hypothetical protein
MLKFPGNEPKGEISKPAANMQIADAGIYLWKEEHPKYAPQPPKECAVCGSTKFEQGKEHSRLLINFRSRNYRQFKVKRRRRRI